MKELFNFRLYLEGLKKIKLIGIAAAIVTVSLCAIVPVIYMADAPYVHDTVYNVEINQFAMPLCVILAFVPFFIKSMFSYLDQRRESDFYHAIPYKRQTVFTSFCLAAITWMVAIICAAVLASAVLWTVAPGTSFEISSVPLLIVSAATACLMLMSFMAVAMALTGTSTSNIFIFGLVACFFRVVCLLFTYSLENTVYIWDASETLLRFTDISFFFPVAFLGATVEVFEPVDVYTNVPMYIYTVVISLLLFILAGWLYVRRRSEMAGKSAPSRKLQHVYRIAFTTPFVLLLFTFIANEIFGSGGTDMTFYVFMVFVICIVYFLYELITTKSPKSMLRSAPYLAVLLVIGVLFAAGIGAVKQVVLSKTPSADEIESVTISESGHSMYSAELDYETLQTQNIRITDKEVLRYVADALKFSVDSVNNGTYSTRRQYVALEGGGEGYSYYTFTTVKIKLTNGQTIGRKIKFTEEDFTGMVTAAKDTDEYGRAYLKIPAPEQIYSIHANGIDYEAMESVYETFYEEYTNELSRDEQIIQKNGSDTTFGYNIECFGRENFKSYTFTMRISQNMPKTLNAYAAALAESEAEHWSDTDQTQSLTNLQAAKKLLSEYIKCGGKLFDEEGSKEGSYGNFSMSAALYLPDGKYEGTFSCYSYQEEDKNAPDPVEAASFILEAIDSGKLRTRYTEGECMISFDASFFKESSAYIREDGGYIREVESTSARMVFFTDSQTADEFSKYVNDITLYDDELVYTEKYYG